MIERKLFTTIKVAELNTIIWSLCCFIIYDITGLYLWLNCHYKKKRNPYQPVKLNIKKSPFQLLVSKIFWKATGATASHHFWVSASFSLLDAVVPPTSHFLRMSCGKYFPSSLTSCYWVHFFAVTDLLYRDLNLKKKTEMPFLL